MKMKGMPRNLTRAVTSLYGGAKTTVEMDFELSTVKVGVQ